MKLIVLLLMAGITEMKVSDRLAKFFNECAAEDVRISDSGGRRIPMMRKCLSNASLWDQTRVDIRTHFYAIEVEWAHNQYEAWGQATWYAEALDRRPMVIIITHSIREDAAHIYRAQTISKKLHIPMYIVELKAGGLLISLPVVHDLHD